VDGTLASYQLLAHATAAKQLAALVATAHSATATATTGSWEQARFGGNWVVWDRRSVDLSIRAEVVVDPIGRTNVVLVGAHILEKFHVIDAGGMEIGVVRVVLAVHEKGFGFLRRKLQGDFLGRVGGSSHDLIARDDIDVGMVVLAPERARSNVAESTAAVVRLRVDLHMIDLMSWVPSPGVRVVLAASKALVQFSSLSLQNPFSKERKLHSVIQNVT